MQSKRVNTSQASLWFVQPAIVAPWKAWLFGAIGCAVATVWFCAIAQFRVRFPFSVPTNVGLTAACIAVTVWVFLRYQDRAFALMLRPEFRPRFFGALFQTGCSALPVLVVFSLLGYNAMAGPMQIMLTLGTVGASLAYAGSIRRVGNELRCAACGYECRTSGKRCTECGNYWLEPDGKIRGHRVVQRGAIAAGIIVMLIGMVGMFPTPFSLDRLGLYLMPDSIRIRAVTVGDPWFAEGKLEDLLAGPLSLENELFLATRLLDQRLKEEYLSETAVTWLDGKVLAGGLTDSIRIRFFEEMAEMWLEGPDKVAVGEPFSPGIVVRDRKQLLGSSLTLQVYFAGVSTDGGRTFEGRRNFAGGPMSVGHVWYRAGQRHVLSEERRLHVSIDAPGEHEIVVRMWLVVVPTNIRSVSAKWNDDGTPDLPKAALWTKEVVLRRTVSVEEN